MPLGGGSCLSCNSIFGGFGGVPLPAILFSPGSAAAVMADLGFYPTGLGIRYRGVLLPFEEV